jgi:quinol monooxygenase YgiN
MTRLRIAALALALSVGGTVAQETQQTFAVTYIEALPARDAEVKAELRRVSGAHASAGRAVIALERTDKPHQFALLEMGDGPVAAEELRTILQPMLTAPLDVRPHAGLSMGEAKPGPIVVLTHIGIVPDKKDVGLAAVLHLAENSRHDPGERRFDVLQQNSRPNHFTLVETWADRSALATHAAAAHMRAFREALMPMSGSLYDERLYRILE